MDDYIVYNGELYHYGVKGMKWGVRKYQNSDGSLTAKGQKRYAKNEAYKNKLINKARKKADKHRDYADEAEYNIRDLKKRGTRSDAYKQWKEERDSSREWEYERNHKFTDDAGNKYYQKYSRSGEKFANDVFDAAFSKVTIQDLIDENYVKARRHKDEAKRWSNNQKNLMNLEVSALTSKSEIRKAYRGRK